MNNMANKIIRITEEELIKIVNNVVQNGGIWYNERTKNL